MQGTQKSTLFVIRTNNNQYFEIWQALILNWQRMKKTERRGELIQRRRNALKIFSRMNMS
jgi:hypothetical protein